MRPVVLVLLSFVAWGAQSRSLMPVSNMDRITEAYGLLVPIDQREFLSRYQR